MKKLWAFLKKVRQHLPTTSKVILFGCMVVWFYACYDAIGAFHAGLMDAVSYVALVTAPTVTVVTVYTYKAMRENLNKHGGGKAGQTYYQNHSGYYPGADYRGFHGRSPYFAADTATDDPTGWDDTAVTRYSPPGDGGVC